MAGAHSVSGTIEAFLTVATVGAYQGMSTTARVGTWTAARGTALVPRSSVGLGAWGEARLAQVLGGAGTVPTGYFRTTLGRRLPDRLVDGVAHEAKAGLNVLLTPTIRRQILADADLIKVGRISGAHWHFFQGADESVLLFLQRHGIPYTLY
jgi:hypothetical protein